MFKIKLKNGGINTERRSAENISNRVFLCEEMVDHKEYVIPNVPRNLTRERKYNKSIEQENYISNTEELGSCNDYYNNCNSYNSYNSYNNYPIQKFNDT